jgi:NAD(P)-dependent dehydrogenase (short-subunit alcohol dehydrogenase family)
VIDSLKSISPNTAVHFIQVELSDFASVRRAAEAVKALGTKIDTLLNNAGIMALHEYTTNGDGIEMQFATNHLGPFLLTNLLLPSLAPGGRVVNVSSAGHALGDVRFTDWNFQDGRAYDEWAAYGQGKCANVLFARALAGKGVKAWSLHPGNIHGTGLAKDLVNPDWELVARMFESVGRPMPGLKTVEEGCATIVLACVGEGLVDGGYLNDCRVEESTAFSSDLGNAERLWELSERLVGAKFDV